VRRRYIRRYVRTPAIRRERSIDLSFVVARPPCRFHATSRYPHRCRCWWGGRCQVWRWWWWWLCCWLQGVARKEKRLSLTHRLHRITWPCSLVDGSTGGKRKEKPKWLSVTANHQAPPMKPVDTARAKVLRLVPVAPRCAKPPCLTVPWWGSRCAWEEKRRASGVREVEQRRRVVRCTFLVRSSDSNRQRRSTVT